MITKKETDMSIRTIEQVKESLLTESPFPCDFKLGDTVMFTNEADLVFGPYKVIGFTNEPLYGRFIHIDYDCYWFPCEPNSLSHV